ncbi:MAG: Maf family protein [Endomicrobiales bacterium]
MRPRKPPVILASASPRRSALLARWGVRFEVIPSHADEETDLKRPASIVKALALRKARSVAASLERGLVIGADTIVVLGGDIIGKPRDRRDAERILSRLNGSYHRVYSGIAVVNAATGETKLGYEVSRVKMRRLNREEIARLAGKHLDKAGAYAVQEKSDAFVEKIEGDYFNVVGLPFLKLKQLLSAFGVVLRKP